LLLDVYRQRRRNHVMRGAEKSLIERSRVFLWINPDPSR